MYLPLAAVVVAVVVGGYLLWERISRRFAGSPPALPLVVAALLALVLGGVTFRRNRDYRSELAIWEDTARKQPDNPRAVANLVLALGAADRWDEALVWARHGVAVLPQMPGTRYFLGRALAGSGRHAEAVAEFRRAAELMRAQGGEYDEAHFHMAVSLAALGRKAQAITEYRAALRGRDTPEARNNLALLLEDRGSDADLAEALNHLETAVRIRPEYFDAQYNLGRLLWRLERYHEALAHFAMALQLSPDAYPVYFEAAWLLGTSDAEHGGNAEMAVTLAKEACQLTHNQDAHCLDALGAAYASAGRFDAALKAAEAAAALAGAHGQTRVVEEIRARMELYRAGRPYRQTPFQTPATAPATQGSGLGGEDGSEDRVGRALQARALAGVLEHERPGLVAAVEYHHGNLAVGVERGDGFKIVEGAGA
jgi:tetratricopeptide (TPR) repeat protein